MSLGQDLADFLLARTAEDEDQARTFLADNHAALARTDAPFRKSAMSLLARALAESKAKRKIVEELRTVSAHADTEYDSGRMCAFTASLMLLADVYADHPDYDDTWRP